MQIPPPQFPPLRSFPPRRRFLLEHRASGLHRRLARKRWRNSEFHIPRQRGRRREWPSEA
eukprot:scaffold305946_cov13-Tisochrysis_lutea.AAC.1